MWKRIKKHVGKICIILCIILCFYGFYIWIQGYTTAYSVDVKDLEKIELNHRYYLKWDKFELQCTKKQFDYVKIKKEEPEASYTIEVNGNIFLEKNTKWYNISIYRIYKDDNEVEHKVENEIE